MISYKRHQFRSERCEPRPMSFEPESDFGTSFKNYLKDRFTIPWYGYAVFAIMIAVTCFFAGWTVILILCIIPIGYVCAALYTAKVYRDLYMADSTIVVDEEGVHYAVVLPEDNDGLTRDDIEDQGKITVRYTSSSAWQELNEIRVFDDFIVLRFIATSKLRIVYIPMANEEYKDEQLNNILAYWDAAADNVPKGFDRRLLLFILIVVMIVLKFLRHRYMN